MAHQDEQSPGGSVHDEQGLQCLEGSIRTPVRSNDSLRDAHGEQAISTNFSTGLVVEHAPPYAVLAVGDLMDPAGNRQEDTSYGNQTVWAGSDDNMLDALYGKEGSDATLVLARNFKEYEVKLKRHILRSDMSSRWNIPSAPELRKSRMTMPLGGVGIAVRRLETQQDQGPVLVHRVNEFSQMHGKVEPGDRLVSVNSEGITDLPMNLIHALIDGPHDTPLVLEFEHLAFSQNVVDTFPGRLAFWKGLNRDPSDVVEARTFELVRNRKLALSRATDDDDWVYKLANPRNIHRRAKQEDGPRDSIGAQDEPFGMVTGLLGLGVLTGAAEQEKTEEDAEPVLGVLQVVISSAKNLPVVSQMGIASVFARVTCGNKTFSTDEVDHDKSKNISVVNPVFNAIFEFPIRQSDQDKSLLVEVRHKEAFFSETPFGSLELPKAASFVSSKGTQHGWYALVATSSEFPKRDEEGQRPLIHLRADWLPSRDDPDVPTHWMQQPHGRPESGMISGPGVLSRLGTPAMSGLGTPRSRLPSGYLTATSPHHDTILENLVPSQPDDRVLRCLRLINMWVSSPVAQGGDLGYDFQQISRDFMENERYEAYAVLTSVTNLKDQLLKTSNREQELEYELQNALNKCEQRSAAFETERGRRDEEGRLCREKNSLLNQMLQLKDMELRDMSKQLEESKRRLDETNREVATLQSSIEQRNKTIGSLTDAAGSSSGSFDDLQKKLNIANEELLVTRINLDETKKNLILALEQGTLQACAPWASRFKATWSGIKDAHAEHVTQLNTKLDDLLGPMNVIKRILHDLSHFLPTAISMVQACEMRDNEVREELHKEYSLIQRISSWMQTLDDHSTVRHQSFITFRRRFEITSQNDPAWKQVLEQEVVQLQDHVERVNADLKSCAMALHEALAAHENANKLIQFISQTREHRLEAHDSIKANLQDYYRSMNEPDRQLEYLLTDLGQILTDHYSNQKEVFEQGESEIEDLMDQVLYAKELHASAFARTSVTSARLSNRA